MDEIMGYEDLLESFLNQQRVIRDNQEQIKTLYAELVEAKGLVEALEVDVQYLVYHLEMVLNFLEEKVAEQANITFEARMALRDINGSV